MPADGGEEIVEVMGDAPGEPADRLHPLRLPVRLLDLVPGVHHAGELFADMHDLSGPVLEVMSLLSIGHRLSAADESLKSPRNVPVDRPREAAHE